MQHKLWRLDLTARLQGTQTVGLHLSLGHGISYPSATGCWTSQSVCVTSTPSCPSDQGQALSQKRHGGHATRGEKGDIGGGATCVTGNVGRPRTPDLCTRGLYRGDQRAGLGWIGEDALVGRLGGLSKGALFGDKAWIGNSRKLEQQG